MNSSTTGKRTGRSSKGKEGGESLFQWVCNHRDWPVEKPRPGLQNALLYKGCLRAEFILDFCGTLKADDYFMCWCFPITNFSICIFWMKRSFSKILKSLGEDMQNFTQLPDNSCYSAPCVPPHHQHALQGTVTFTGMLGKEKFLEVKFLKVLKYLLGDKKAEIDGILYYLELHVPFHYFLPKRESIPQAMVTCNRLVPQTGWVYLWKFHKDQN